MGKPIGVITGAGKMDKDTDPLKMDDKDYRDALDVEDITDSTGSTQGKTPSIGNLLAFNIPSIPTRFKIYRIFVGQDGVTNHSLNFYTQNGFLWATATYVEGVTYAATIVNALAAIAALPLVVTSTAGATYFDFNISTLKGYDYKVTSDALTNPQVLQDPVDVSMAGESNDIGSYDLLGDLFVWSTPQKNLPTDLSVTITNVVNSGGRFLVTTSAAHGLSTGEVVSISGVNGTPLVNGVFWITVISNVSFKCEEYYANFAGAFAASPNSKIKRWVNGFGQIGVGTYDINADAWTYTSLVQSKKLNFRTKKQIATWVERSCDDRVDAYWVDAYNTDRVMYYRGAYSANGYLSVYNSSALYSLDSVDAESRMTAQKPGALLTFSQQYQGGGAVKSGNWRYTTRFLTDSFSATDWGDLSNPVPVYLMATNSTNPLGSAADVTTSKINELVVTNIPAGIFKYIELAGVNYVDGAEVGYLISRTLLTSTQTTITLLHTGLETDTQNLDLATLNSSGLVYGNSRNICVLDTRMVRSDLLLQQEKDLTNFFNTFKHRLLQKKIDTQGSTITSNMLPGPFEGRSPSIIFNDAGYMLNETYRLLGKARYKNSGKISKNFWIDDIIINAGNVNTANPTDNRRIAGGGIPSFDLTEIGVTSTYPKAIVPYIEFSGFDISTLIDGVPFRDIFDFIYIERVECVPEILGSGIAVLSVATNVVARGVFALTDGTDLWAGTGALSDAFEWPGVIGRNDGLIEPYGQYAPGPITNNNLRTIAALYFPDVILNNTAISWQNGDKVINYGASIPMQIAGPLWPNITSGVPTYNSVWTEYNGYTNITANPAPINVSAVVNIARGSSALIGGVTVYKHLLHNAVGPTAGYTWSIQSSPVIQSAANLTNVGAGADYGLYMVQYYRPLTNKYGAKETSKGIPTGTYLQIVPTTPNVIPTGVVSVFGGDVITQRSYLNWRNPDSTAIGFGGGIGFYSQNRVNWQLQQGTPTGIGDYPFIATGVWLEYPKNEDYEYNKGYNLRNDVTVNTSFDPNNIDCIEYRTRFIWSPPRPIGSAQDNYRLALPLDFHDLDPSNGPIVHHDIFNQELISFQPRQIQRQYFNTRGELQSGGLGIVIGDGSVMARDGQSLTSLGCSNKWAIIKGLSSQGNDTFYWINTELKCAVRLGYDGSINLGVIKGMKSWFDNNLRWVTGKDTPADGQGICGVWDQNKLQVIWTVRGKKNVTAWSNTTNYIIGQVVYFAPTTFSTFEQTGEFYRALTNNIATQPDTSTSDWQLIAHTDTDFYNEYTLSYSEFKDGFAKFHTFKPKIYLRWKDVFLTPRPISDTGNNYVHYQGLIAQWYDQLGINQQSDPYFEGVVNKGMENTNWFEKLKIEADIVPLRMDFTTKTQVSFLTQAEMDQREDGIYAPIKEDSTSNGLNDSGTSLLFGQYMFVKFTFSRLIYNKLSNIFVSMRPSARKVDK